METLLRHASISMKHFNLFGTDQINIPVLIFPLPPCLNNSDRKLNAHSHESVTGSQSKALK